jgi:glycosyltransferase involved in cell wall biosynthesis
MRQVLMAAFHYPPYRGSSGIQRTLKFSRYLPENGWRPIVLSATPNAYVERSDDLLREIPANVVVARALAFDAARHFSVAGRYPGWLAWPDRWGSWLAGGMLRGALLARTQRVSVLWSTFPIATAHVLAANLKAITGLPWVADFRDPMWEHDYPPDIAMRKRAARIEGRTVRSADKVVVTTEGTQRLMWARYPDVPRDRFVVIANGYDEENFTASEKRIVRKAPNGPVRVIHSGTLYPRERDPSALFLAVSQLKQRSQLDGSKLRIVLRATAHDAEIASLIARYGVGDIVEIASAVKYEDALTEMMEADALLLLQGEDCNQQVPAKLYEYLRAGTPVLALAGKQSDTVEILSGAGNMWWAPPAATEDIARALERLMAEARLKQRATNWEYVRKYDRRAQAAELAQLLADVTS